MSNGPFAVLLFMKTHGKVDNCRSASALKGLPPIPSNINSPQLPSLLTWLQLVALVYVGHNLPLIVRDLNVNAFLFLPAQLRLNFCVC